MASAKARGDALRQRLEDARPRSRAVDVAFVSLERDAVAAGSVLGAAVAFRVFLFAVPYTVAIVYGFGLTASVTGADPQDLAQSFGIVGLLASTITAADEQTLFTRVVVFTTALYALITTARSLLKVLAIVHALAWQMPLERIRRLTKPALVLILIFTGGTALVQLIVQLRERSLAAALVAQLLFIAVPISVWLVLSWRFFVHAPGAGWRDLLPGAVLVGVGVQVLHLVTVYWIAYLLESRSETYGAIGAALAILLWAYILGRLLTTSAVLNAGAWQQRHPEGDER